MGIKTRTPELIIFINMIHQLASSQHLRCNIESAWDFFSSPHNLANITPKDMNFTVLGDTSGQHIYEGMIINYTVSPLLGIPLKWQTQITQVDHGKSFTDFQQKGPYKLWRHKHEFIEKDGGVLMKDTVDYELPLGFLGSIAHTLIVKKKLETIFNYRYQVLEHLFNQEK
jgi:ligand-binding SRPBCC domain-containing protein